jgi:hypothetical protein
MTESCLRFPCQIIFMSFDSNTTGVTCGAGTANHSGTPEFTPGFSESRVAQSLVFCVVFGRSLFVLLSFFSWPLCFLFSFDLRLLITPFGIFKLFLMILRMNSCLLFYVCVKSYIA